MILALGYAAYIAIMYFNPYLSKKADELSEKWRQKRGKDSLPLPPDTEPLLTGKEVDRTRYGSVGKDCDIEHTGYSNGTLRNHSDSKILSESGKKNQLKF